MRITKYGVELTDELHPSLVKEQAFILMAVSTILQNLPE